MCAVCVFSHTHTRTHTHTHKMKLVRPYVRKYILPHFIQCGIAWSLKVH